MRTISPSLTSIVLTIEVSSGCTSMVEAVETSSPGVVTTLSSGKVPITTSMLTARPPTTQIV